MAEQITRNAEALKLLFTEDIYLIPNELDVTETPAEAPVLLPEIKEAVTKKAFKFVGQNARNILILVNDQQYPVSTEEGRALLANLIKAINLMTADYALLNYSTCEGSSFDELVTHFKPQFMLCFGLPPARLGLDAQPEHVLGRQKEVDMIFSLDLPTLNTTMDAKKALWKSLQQLQLS